MLREYFTSNTKKMMKKDLHFFSTRKTQINQ